ncbi:cupin domain-containing protein [Streptomyces albus]|uniref:cupin domain-containing protein n=1 Tax=Streptomyces albus TaxID=1888 RepID=UPI0033C9E0BC
MSYPNKRYFGDKGEVSAVYRPGDTAPDVRSGGGGAMHYLSRGTDTDGHYGLYRVDLAAGSGTSTHFHKTMSEAFYLLSGKLRLFDGERWFEAKAGDYAYVPPGGLHAFRNETGELTSFLMLFAPGAPREEYFERLGEVAQMSEEERLDFFLAHDNHFTDTSAGPSGPIAGYRD